MIDGSVLNTWPCEYLAHERPWLVRHSFSIFDVSYSENTCSIYGSSMARTVTIRRLTTKLHLARRRVRRLEMLLYLAEREEAARCDHL